MLLRQAQDDKHRDGHPELVEGKQYKKYADSLQ